MRIGMVVLLALLAVGAVWAQNAPVDVMYAGDVVLRVQAGVGDTTPEMRAACINQHLCEAISAVFATPTQVFDPKTVVIKPSPRKSGCRYQIWAGKVMIVGVMTADAKANGCCTQQLAARWLKNIKAALTKATHDC